MAFSAFGDKTILILPPPKTTRDLSALDAHEKFMKDKLGNDFDTYQKLNRHRNLWFGGQIVSAVVCVVFMITAVMLLYNNDWMFDMTTGVLFGVAGLSFVSFIVCFWREQIADYDANQFLNSRSIIS